MKKFSVLFLAMLFCFVCSCGSSGSKEKDDSDQIGETDVDTTDDSDTVDNSDKDQTNDSDGGKTDDSDTQEAVTDSNTADDSDTEKDDSDPIESGICSPNPCDNAENQAAHKTRCMPENNGTSYTCECDSSYYSYGDICCPAHSSEKGGKCQCDTYYVEPEEEPGKCVAACSENTIEGLNGYCKGDYICQQGTCIKDRCASYTCPENSTCTTKNDEPFCQCDSPLQMSSGKCCPQNSTNVNGTCKCNTGYELSGDNCVMSANNPCKTKPCSQSHNPGTNKNTCVPDSSEAGYHCACNTNYEEDSSGTCQEIHHDVCPNNMQCLAQRCLPLDLSNEQCVKNSDCREFPGSNTICSAPNAAGGICSGCSDASDCPGNTQCMESTGTCALMCDSDNDCPYGKCYANGYCGQKHCSTDEDCFGGTVCIGSTGDNDGMCQRAACNETACSFSNPHGTCPNEGEACINGECVSSCSPNPCNETNKTCEIKLGVPTCVCVEGTVEKNGKCQPKTQACPNGFVCKGGYCADTNDPTFFCAENSDCGGSMTCTSASLPSGQCNGCAYTSDCPGANTDEAVTCVKAGSSGYCMRSCLTNDECSEGMICRTSGLGSFCGRKECSKPSDCPENYTCKPSSDSSESGTCSRIPCE